MKNTISILSTIMFVLLFSFCAKDQATDPQLIDCNNPTEVSYQNDILPIMETSCAIPTCHENGFPLGDFTTYESTFSYLEDGKIENRAITVGNMPPPSVNPLSDCEVELLQHWIDAGYPDN